MATIDITVTVSELTKKVKQHLALIGKRVKGADGKPLYSDLTTSTAEDALIWQDLFAAGADMLVGSIQNFTGDYTDENDTIHFNVESYRWDNQIDDEGNDITDNDLTKALAETIKRFIWNYAIKEYLSIIHPSTGEKYPPIFGNTYAESMAVAIASINDLLKKRVPISVSSPYSQTLMLGGSAIRIVLGKEETVTYSIAYDATDDIDFIATKPIIEVKKHFNPIKGGWLTVKGNREGDCVLVVFSKHDELNVRRELHITVIPEEE